MTAPDDLVERVARAIKVAVEQMPYLDMAKLDDNDVGVPVSLRSFYENTWQGAHAERLFSEAAHVAARAAIAEVLKDWPEIERMRLGKQ
jgi:hypothetical protein